MPSADFAAAQARLQARRREREAVEQSRRAEQEAARVAATSRLPFPFRNIGDASLTVWDKIRGREGTGPAFRVGQVDAELLDEELLELLKGQIGEALKYYGTHLHTDYGPEILLALRAILFKLTIWDHNASYGASLQGLRYTDARDKSLNRPPPRAWQKGVYGLVTVLGRYGWTKWESYLSDLEGGYDEPSPLMKQLSEATSRLSTIHSVTALASFLRFLYNGRYRTLLDRFLRLRLVPTSAHTSREVSFEYLNRQLVWHAFTEFLLFLLPLVGISRWRRMIGRSYRRIILFLKRSFGRGGSDDDEEAIPKGELGFLPERTCAICYSDQNPTAAGGSEAEILAATAGGGVVGSAQTDITNPYEAIPCGDVYCFVCIAQKIEGEEGEGWTCLRCGEVVKECKPWNGDVLEEQPRPGTGSGKSVGFGFSDNSVDEKGIAMANGHEGLREVEPMPTEDEDEEHAENEMNVNSSTSLVDMHGIDESAEWARASRYVNGDTETETETETNATGSDDEQSEEYDEEEADDIDGFE